jgi:RNA polymerase sigma-B factor
VVNPVVRKDVSPSLLSHTRTSIHDRRTRTRANAVERLVTMHAYLCRRGARKFLRTGLERSDLEQVAAVGLIKAARRYDIETDTPFEAYAWMTILGELLHFVRDHERSIRVPRRLRDFERRLFAAQEALTARLGRTPSEHELAGELGVSLGFVAEIRRAQATTHLLDVETVRSALPSEASGIEERLLFRDALASLDDLERRVVVGLYVLGMTQTDVARRLGVSVKRVLRSKRSALATLKKAWTR